MAEYVSNDVKLDWWNKWISFQRAASLPLPDKALVLCCDEKSQCQALERTQPGLPLGIGHIRTKTHDYVRQGLCLSASTARARRRSTT